MAQENIGIVVFLFVGIAILGFAIHWFVTLKSKLQKFDLLNCIVVGHEKKKFRSLKPFHINVNYLFSPEVEYHTHADAKPKIHKDPLMLFYQGTKLANIWKYSLIRKARKRPFSTRFCQNTQEYLL